MSDIKLINAFNGMNVSSYGGTLCDTGNDDICEFDMIDQASDAAYAINSHNGLVKQNKELKNQNKDIKAQAVMSVIDNVKSFSAFGSSKMISVDDIIKYANTIKESEDE